MKDTNLIKRCQKGDEKAFDELIRMYYPFVLGFLLNAVQNESLAEDLVQETFLKRIRNIEKFSPGGKALFSTWLITIAKNCLIDSLRRKDSARLPIEEDLADRTDVAEKAVMEVLNTSVHEALSLLPKEQSKALLLMYEEDLSLEEISRLTGVPAKTVKSRIHEGKTKLRRMFS